jgi:predicted dehydrogenase/threonine dehydrogenase-like Zn-dependent dehydrogenase
MKQVLQDLRSGETSVVNVPVPALQAGQVLIRTHRTLISPGTERMLVNFSRSGMIGKARSQPDKVRQVLDKCKTDGIAAAMEAVARKLDEPLPLGYCNAGTVLDVGEGVSDLRPGDRVASNGHHAQVVAVGRNLCAKIPDKVTDDQAAFTVLGAIGLQGIRLAKPEMGERVVVYGLGLIGQVCVQLLHAAGCEVLGVDLDGKRLALAHRQGAQVVNVACEDPIAAAEGFSRGAGVDAVLITASADGDRIVRNAATMCRKRGRIVLVGVVGLNLNRDEFFRKELTFQVSCSYGPGRYDPNYEQKGIDYPMGYVRWTQQRNFQAVLGAIASGRLDVAPLISHRFPIHGAQQAYELLRRGEDALGVMLEYPPAADLSQTVRFHSLRRKDSQCRIGLIGAGSFARAQLLPALARAQAQIRWIAGAGGVSARHAARKFRAGRATTDVTRILQDVNVDAIVIATRHDLHADLICRALEAGKHVFVEKPLALNATQLERVYRTASKHSHLQLAVGFNRRFSPHTGKLIEAIGRRTQPLRMVMTVNAGWLPADHWTCDPRVGGGRIVGEACHFIDLLSHLAGAGVTAVSASGDESSGMTILLELADGSTGTLHYFTNGSKRYPKEILEVHSQGRTFRLENFRRLRSWGPGTAGTFKTFRQDKGHRQEIDAFCRSVRTGGEALMELDRLANVTLASFAACQAAGRSTVVDVAAGMSKLRQDPQPAPARGAQVLQSATWPHPKPTQRSAQVSEAKLAS